MLIAGLRQINGGDWPIRGRTKKTGYARLQSRDLANKTRPMPWKPTLTTQQRRDLIARLRKKAADPKQTPEQRAETLRVAKNLEQSTNRRELRESPPKGTA